MYSAKIVTRPDKNNLLMIRVINNRKISYVSLGQNVTNEDLNLALSATPPQALFRLSRLLKVYNAKLEEARTRIILEQKTHEEASAIAAIIKEAIFGEDKVKEEEDRKAKKIMPFFRRIIDRKKNEGYKASFNYTYSSIETYLENSIYQGPKMENLKFDDITLKWLYDFDYWLCEEGMSQNTRNIHFKNIRTVINAAIDEELTSNYPFRRFKIRQAATRKRSLPVEDLRKLFTCDVEPYQEFYRDMFKLIFMLCGINAIDLYNLTEITNEGRVEYSRAKTHRLYSIKVEPEAMEIINKYKGEKKLLCIADRWNSHRDFTKFINISLKKIGDLKIVGRGGKKEITPYWPELSTYWARHSWATIARKIGISKDDIALALGHSTGHDITDIYINEDNEKIDIANRRVLDFVLYNK